MPTAAISGSKAPALTKKHIPARRSLFDCRSAGILMKVPEHEGRDWAIIAVIILIGFLCVLLAGYWALRFAPSWQLTADMGSKLDPLSDFLTRRPGGFVEPVDPSILTQPVWINVFLTPGAIFSTRPPNATTTPAFFLTPTRIASATHTGVFVASATNTSTLVYFPPT